MNFFTSWDLAISAKKHGDTSCVMTIGVNKEGHRFVVACKTGILNPGQVIDEIFKQVRKFNPLESRAEKAALEQVLDYFLHKAQAEKKVYFLYDYLEKNSVDSKEFRIKSMQPLFKAGKMHFPVDVDIDGINELLYQLQGYIKTGPTTKHIDCVDTLANFMDPNFIIEPMGFTGSEIKGDEYDYSEMGENIDNYDF